MSRVTCSTTASTCCCRTRLHCKQYRARHGSEEAAEAESEGSLGNDVMTLKAQEEWNIKPERSGVRRHFTSTIRIPFKHHNRNDATFGRSNTSQTRQLGNLTRPSPISQLSLMHHISIIRTSYHIRLRSHHYTICFLASCTQPAASLTRS